MQEEQVDEQQGATTERKARRWTVHPSMVRNHPMLLLLYVLLIVGGCAAAWYLRWTDLRPAIRQVGQIACIIISAVALVLLLSWWLHCKGTAVTVDERRTILRRGLLGKRTVEVQHADVRSLEIRQNFIQRVLGVGEIAIGSAGSGEVEIIVAGIPRPDRIAEVVREHQLD